MTLSLSMSRRVRVEDRPRGAARSNGLRPAVRGLDPVDLGTFASFQIEAMACSARKARSGWHNWLLWGTIGKNYAWCRLNPRGAQGM